MKKITGVLMFLALLFSCAVAFGQEAKKADAPKPAATEAKKVPNEAKGPATTIDPSPEFMAEWAKLVGIQEVISDIEAQYASLDTFRGRANAIADRLGAQVPKGYAFSRDTRKFVLVPKPAEQPPAAPADKK